MLNEDNMKKKENREKMKKIMFEKLKKNEMYVEIKDVM